MLLAAATAATAATNRMAIGFAEYSLASNRLELADIADPAKPLSVCHFEIEGFTPEAISASNGVLRVESADGFAEFDISDIFAPEPAENTATNGAPAEADYGLLLAACGWDGVKIFRPGADGEPPVEVTHCLTEGPALGVAAIPGGFAVALGTRGYALYDLDDAGLVTLRRQWPLDTGRAVSVAYDPETDEVSFDCQESGVRKVKR